MVDGALLIVDAKRGADAPDPLRAAKALSKAAADCVHQQGSIGRGVDPEQAVDKVLDLFLGARLRRRHQCDFPICSASGMAAFAKPDWRLKATT